MDKKFLTAIANGVLHVGDSMATYLAEQHKTAVEKEKLAQAHMQEMNRQYMRYQLKPDYIKHGNIVCRCLESNYGPCGLCRPHNIEDVCFSDIAHAIDWDSDGALIYRYEATRRISDMYIGGMKKLEYPRVPVEEIEARLQQELPKYMVLRNCSYQNLTVEDYSEDKVVIKLKGGC